MRKFSVLIYGKNFKVIWPSLSENIKWKNHSYSLLPANI